MMIDCFQAGFGDTAIEIGRCISFLCDFLAARLAYRAPLLKGQNLQSDGCLKLRKESYAWSIRVVGSRDTKR